MAAINSSSNAAPNAPAPVAQAPASKSSVVYPVFHKSYQPDGDDGSDPSMPSGAPAPQSGSGRPKPPAKPPLLRSGQVRPLDPSARPFVPDGEPSSNAERVDKIKVSIPWVLSTQQLNTVISTVGDVYNVVRDTSSHKMVAPVNYVYAVEKKILMDHVDVNRFVELDYATLTPEYIQRKLVLVHELWLIGRSYNGRGNAPDERWRDGHVFRGELAVRCYLHDWLQGTSSFEVEDIWYRVKAENRGRVGHCNLIRVHAEETDTPPVIPLWDALKTKSHSGPVDAPNLMMRTYSSAYYCTVAFDEGEPLKVPKDLVLHLITAGAMKVRDGDTATKMGMQGKAWCKTNDINVSHEAMAAAIMIAMYVGVRTSAEMMAQALDKYGGDAAKYNEILGKDMPDLTTWAGWLRYQVFGANSVTTALKRWLVQAYSFAREHPWVTMTTAAFAYGFIKLKITGPQGRLFDGDLIGVTMEECLKRVHPAVTHVLAWTEFVLRAPHVPLWSNFATVAMHYASAELPLPLGIGLHAGYNWYWDTHSVDSHSITRWFERRYPPLAKPLHLRSPKGLMVSRLSDITNPLVGEDHLAMENFIVHANQIVLPPGNSYTMPYEARAFRSPCLVSVGIHCPVYAPRSLSRNVANEEAALVLRHANNFAVIDEKEMARFRTWVHANIDELLPITKVEAVRFSEWNDRFPSGRRRAHRIAWDSIREIGYGVKQIARSKAFVKIERLAAKGALIELPDPRLIQGTTDESNVVIGPWMYAFSKKLAEVWNGVTSQIMYVSGCHTEDFSQLVYEAGVGHNAVYVENDFSRFDSTVSVPMLELETWIYQRCGAPKRVLELLRAKYTTRGTTSCGIKYTIVGTRKSGEPNTSCGNTLLNALMHAYCLKGQKYLMLALGDDNLVVGANTLEVDFTPMARLGFRPKTKISRDPFEVEFCSMTMYPVKGQTGWLFTPKAGRLLAKMPFDYSNAPRRIMEGRLRANFMGLYDDIYHIELLRQVFDQHLKLLDPTPRFTPDHKVHVKRRHEADDETLVVFLNRYGISREELLHLVSVYRSVRILPKALDDPILRRVIERDC